MTISWSTPAWLWPLLLIIAVGAVLWVVRAYSQTRPQAPPHLGRVLVWLRSAALLLLVVAIAGPIIVRLMIAKSPAEIVIILEDSGSMMIADAGGGDETADPEASTQSITRWTRALQVAAEIEATLADLPQDVKRVYMRGNGLSPVVEFRLDDPVVTEPVGHGTDLALLQRQVMDRSAGRPTRAVVLLSDGQETAGWGDRSNLSRTGRTDGATRGTPLFVIGVGDENGPPDRILKDLRYPDTAYEGDRVVVEFAVDHRYLPEVTTGDGKRQITARLRGPHGIVADTTITSADDLVPFELTFTVAEEGLQAYELAVDVLDNERFPANNKATLAINIRQDRSRVLLLSALPSWDIRFLAQAASWEQRLALSVVYPNADGLVFADSLTSWTNPTTVEQWLRWDAVILSGWTAGLSSLDWALLDRAVNQGLGLLVMAGSGSGAGGGPVPFPPPPELTELLPISPLPWRWLAGPFFAESPGASVGHPVLDGLVGEGFQMNGLPPLAQVADVKANAGTEVLLTGTVRLGNGRRQAPLLVVGGRGQGRVAWFGGRHLWELAFWEANREGGEVGDLTQAGRRLARNLLVWSAAGMEESGLAFTGRQTFFHEGEPIRLTAQWRDMRGRPVSDRTLQLILRHQDEEARSDQTFNLRTSRSRAGFAETVLPPLAPGNYTVQLVGEGEPPVLGPEENLIVARHSLELTQVRMNRRRLIQLAASEAGRFDKADDLTAMLSDLVQVDWRGENRERQFRWSIRNGWPLLILLVTLLGAEWYLRRRHGLL